MSQTFAQLFEESIANQDYKVGDLVQADVIESNGDYVLVTAGLKSEAEISMDQFKTEEGTIPVNVGDSIEVVIEALEDGLGQTRLSFERARRMRAWEDLEGAHESQEIVIGRITNRVKGGFTVVVKDVRAFLPGSLVDVRPTKDSTYLEGKDLEFKVIKIDRARNNIVVSRRAVVENELSAEREELLANLEEGMNVKGYVKNLTEYGAFINLGGLDGLLHITDMSWKRIKHPSEMLEVGQEIEARVLKFDKERQRVSLGLKQMGEDPWADLQRRYPEGARLNGTVTNLTDYGVFVEIEEGVEGLVHVSEMDWTNKNVHPSKLVAVGDEVEVMVLDVDTERRRISLGMKQCTVNPWEAFAATHQKGEKLSGQIKSITDFGVFVGLDGGIDGLIHLSDLSWDRPGEEVVREFKKGDEVEVVVLAVDAERERISLGLKQASGDPFSQYVTEHGKGSLVKGKVISVDAKSAVVELAEGVEGQLRASELSTDRVEDATTVLKEGDEVETKITSIERKTRKISLSIKAIELDAQGEILEEYSRSKPTATTLGDMLRETLEQKDSE